MAFDKVKEVRLWGVTDQNSDVRLTIGDSSGGTFTGRPNPLRGTLVWDDCFYVLHGVSAEGGATGGSYTVTIQTDAVVGNTGLPIAEAIIGPNTARTVVMRNLHNSPGSPLPTHIFIDQTATGGGLDFQCFAIAKQYRGVGTGNSERVIQGNLVRGASFTGGAFVSGKGFVADETVTLGTSSTTLGLNRMREWDRAFYWVRAGNSVSGTHNVYLVATVGGTTFTFAGTTTTVATGVLDAANERLAIASLIGGISPNPTHIIWDVVSAGGVSDARVIVLAKTGRGSMAKE